MSPFATSPFIFDGPMPPDQLAGRHHELGALRDRAAHGRFCLLYGPRRFGKTSLIHRLTADIDVDRSMAVVLVDLQGVLTLDDISRRLATAFQRLEQQGIRPAVSRALAGVADASLRVAGRRAGIDLGAGIIRAEHTQPDASLEALLRIPWDVAERTDRRILVVLDEFQSIADVARADAVLRATIQHQRERVSYLFSGSEQGVLRALFARQAAPLYGQAERFELGPLPGPVATDYVAELFDATDKDPGAALPALIQTAAGHPQRLNLLAHHLWNLVASGEPADDGDWMSAMDVTLTYAEPELVAVWTGLAPNQRRALRLAAWGEPYYGAAAGRLNLNGGSAQAARRGLEERSVVDAEGQLIDPLLGAWLRRQQPAP